MLAPHCIRRLTLDPAKHPRGQPYLSSASGLERIGCKLYIVADDEHHLAQLDAADVAASPLRMLRFAPGVLPDDPVHRKSTKPDLETLIHFPAPATGGNGMLMALGSASRRNRERAFLFAVDPQGELAGEPRELSTTALCDPLRARFGELNLEAGFVAAGRVHLFQRAHRGQPLNGHVIYDAGRMLAWLAGSADVPPPLSIEMVDLGHVDGIPLGITDAAAWADGGWIFCAVAEDTRDAYIDGSCVGSAIGWADDQGRVRRYEGLEGAPKVEGLAIAGHDSLWLVTDADDPSRASELLGVRWPS